MSSLKDLGQYGPILIDPTRILIDNIVYPSELRNIRTCIESALSGLSPHPCDVILDDFMVPSFFIESESNLPLDPMSREAFFDWRYRHLSSKTGELKTVACPIDDKGWILNGIEMDLLENLEEGFYSSGFHVKSIVPKWSYILNSLLLKSGNMPSCLVCLSPTLGGRYRGTLVAWKDSVSLFRQWAEDVNLETWNEERIYPTLAYLERTWLHKPDLYTFGTQKPISIADYQSISVDQENHLGAINAS